ncbi:hypothetical protein BAUCODRAFT_214507 [Baudoinia panamericana UAMH 10762]|uniref:RWD domain-containing protein n=1 Tax=Baudoinia panamericana (strain UAMH 10762) TaxID=717646 RepID=M2N585_BAUPA|nr:uncharacterized protein BAUCODRAFT_214507 [Baudoinia panamericana UAMH 10762]EMC93925.1 hypothetical protein BAUCODRAFT_214507 [Baudoinia panamericana UAMH 10762]
MSAELEDEVTSINSIYGDGTLEPLSEEPAVYALTCPSQPSISLRLEFPASYPDAPPSVLGTQSVGESVPKGEGSYFVGLVRDVLSDIYTPGAPCIFDLVEETGQRLQDLGYSSGAFPEQEAQSTQANSQPVPYHDLADIDPNNHQPLDHLGDSPPWTLSDVITEKKSVFVARAAPVSSPLEARTYLAHLLATDKKVAKATHNITAWRIRGESGVQYQDCDDDGETAAGGRLLHLMELMDVWDAMVVVTRWYGGVLLGPDRFRIINQAARDALVKGGFAADAGKDGGKKKSKK